MRYPVYFFLGEEKLRSKPFLGSIFTARVFLEESVIAIPTFPFVVSVKAGLVTLLQQAGARFQVLLFINNMHLKLYLSTLSVILRDEREVAFDIHMGVVLCMAK